MLALAGNRRSTEGRTSCSTPDPGERSERIAACSPQRAAMRSPRTPITKGDDGQVNGGMRKDLIGIQFTKLLKALDIRRAGVSFYSLRHTFETVAGASKDQVAVDVVMGAH